jgi:hypothetical protein
VAISATRLERMTIVLRWWIICGNLAARLVSVSEASMTNGLSDVKPDVADRRGELCANPRRDQRVALSGTALVKIFLSM